MAALLFAIVLVFFVCHAPKAVINIYEVKIYLTSCHRCITLSFFDFKKGVLAALVALHFPPSASAAGQSFGLA